MTTTTRIMFAAVLSSYVALSYAREPVPVFVEEDSASVAPLIERGELPRDTLTRGVFTTGIQNKEPVDDLTTLSANAQRIYFFSELRDMNGQTVTHRWEHNGILVEDTRFNVESRRWRIWSAKTIGGKAGTWKVKVLNTVGETVGEKSIQIGERPAP